MITETQNLSSGLEDYIETIYLTEQAGTQLKGAELARKLCISRASVSEALSKLVSLGLIEYESYGLIELTHKGEEEAKKVYSKHGILKDFLEHVLLVSEEEAGENACKIEHIISPNVLNKLMKFTEFCQKHPEIIEKYGNTQN